ncbi:MAG: DUF2889 domain-containing protein [Pseudomonadota bacterium]
MPLPTPQSRKHIHTRNVVYRGYQRDDGLWDIDAEMSDTKPYALDRSDRGHIPAGTPVHGMSIRLTIDDSYIIREIVAVQDNRPFGECDASVAPMQRMVGVKIGAGWRKAVEQALGNSKGCTHLREMLFNMATAAFQAIPVYLVQLRVEAGLPEKEPSDKPPAHLGQCIAWDFDGALVARKYPEFAGWQPLVRQDVPPRQS